MKRVVFFMLLVFVFGFIYAAGSQQGNPVSGYDANNNGYYYNNNSGNLGFQAPSYCDLIIYNVLNGNMTDNGDGSGTISLQLSRIPQNTTSFVLMRKVNDGAWETILNWNLCSGADINIGSSNLYVEYFSGAVSGSSSSYKIIFYSSDRLHGISNTIKFVYQ